MRLDVTASKFSVTESLARYIDHRLSLALDRFAQGIDHISVRLFDVNGPQRGGVDKRCRMMVQLAHGPSVIIEDQRDDFYAAVDQAADRLRYVLSRRFERRRHH